MLIEIKHPMKIVSIITYPCHNLRKTAPGQCKRPFMNQKDNPRVPKNDLHMAV